MKYIVDPLEKETADPCPRCHSTTVLEYKQVFADKTEHTRIDCAKCKRFLRFKPKNQSKRSINTRMFSLVNMLSRLDPDQPDLDKQRLYINYAKEIMNDARGLGGQG